MADRIQDMSFTDKEQEWLEVHFDELRREMVQLQIAVATLRVKAGIWGLLGGLIPVGIYVILKWG